MRRTVAIDGPAGAGKSTIAKLLANRYNIMYINTGAMYRAVTFQALNRNILPEEAQKLKSLLDTMEIRFNGDNLILNGTDITYELNLPRISNNVSNYAAIPVIRERLVDMQRNMSKKYEVVMDGRDIGTVVLKDAAFKFYLTAAPEERATRRYNELIAKQVVVNYSDILQDLIKRDYADMNRELNPLKKANDAIEIDSSYLSIEDVVEKMCEYIDKHIIK